MYDALSVANEVFKRFMALPENDRPEKKGAYFTLLEGNTPSVLAIIRLGELPNRGSHSFDFSKEKAFRLHSKISAGHISSWSSRNPDDNKYGGAVLSAHQIHGIPGVTKVIASLSGLSEHGDEAVAAVTMVACKLYTKLHARAVAKISNNQLIAPLMDACKDLISTA